MARFELYGIRDETKDKMQTVAKKKGISVGRLVESIMDRYIEEPNTRSQLRKRF
jgi:predicted DNA-binding ribbon-helix-helix protein